MARKERNAMSGDALVRSPLRSDRLARDRIPLLVVECYRVDCFVVVQRKMENRPFRLDNSQDRHLASFLEMAVRDMSGVPGGRKFAAALSNDLGIRLLQPGLVRMSAVV